MAELEWEPMEGGYTSGLYHIAPLDHGSKHHWRLSTIDDSVPAADFITLTVAQQAAVGLERARIRRSRILTDLAVGCVAATVAMVAGAVMSGLVGFVVMMAAAWLALRSFVGAMSEHLGDAWSWNRAPGTPRRITPFDRAWAGVVDTTKDKVVERISVVEADDPGSEPQVRILPPEPPG